LYVFKLKLPASNSWSNNDTTHYFQAIGILNLIGGILIPLALKNSILKILGVLLVLIPGFRLKLIRGMMKDKLYKVAHNSAYNQLAVQWLRSIMLRIKFSGGRQFCAPKSLTSFSVGKLAAMP
jgi:hypothetical protein